jgi:hypothetical protein
MAGTVEAAGRNAAEFRPGDEVFGGLTWPTARTAAQRSLGTFDQPLDRYAGELDRLVP